MKVKELVNKLTNKIRTGAFYIAFASSVLSVAMPTSAYAVKKDGFEVKDFNFSKSMSVSNYCPGVYVMHTYYVDERTKDLFYYLKNGEYHSNVHKKEVGTGSVSFKWIRTNVAVKVGEENGHDLGASYHAYTGEHTVNCFNGITSVVWQSFTKNPTEPGAEEYKRHYNYGSGGAWCRTGGKASTTHFVGGSDEDGEGSNLPERYKVTFYGENGGYISHWYNLGSDGDTWIFKANHNPFLKNVVFKASSIPHQDGYHSIGWCMNERHGEHNWNSWSSNTADATVVCSRCGKSSNQAYGTRSESYCRNNNNAEVKIGGTANYGVTMTLNYRDLSNNAVSKVLSGGSDQVIAVYPGSNPSINL